MKGTKTPLGSENGELRSRVYRKGENLTRELTAVSLFSGAGGMDLGFERAGFRILFANELMPEAAATYTANRPADVMVQGDILKLIDKVDAYRGCDLVFGGPPCQGFSVAGKMDPNDARNRLIFTFLDAVKRIQPRAFVMENVKALGVFEKWGSIRDKYLEAAREIGYDCIPFILDSTEYGVPQKRERVFFIGIRENSDPRFKERMDCLLKRHREKAPSVRAQLFSLGKAGTEANPNTCTARITFATRPVLRKSPFAGMYFNGQGRPIDIDGYANTLPASMGGNKTPILDEEFLYGNAESDWSVGYHKALTEEMIRPMVGEAPNRLRRITIREAARIQTFPDDYIFCGKKGKIYTQIGNAVPSKLAEAVARAVIEYLSETR